MKPHTLSETTLEIVCKLSKQCASWRLSQKWRCFKLYCYFTGEQASQKEKDKREEAKTYTRDGDHEAEDFWNKEKAGRNLQQSQANLPTDSKWAKRESFSHQSRESPHQPQNSKLSVKDQQLQRKTPEDDRYPAVAWLIFLNSEHHLTVHEDDETQLFFQTVLLLSALSYCLWVPHIVARTTAS